MKKTFALSIALLSWLPAGISLGAEPLAYPEVPRGEAVDHLAVEIPDPYRWLEDLESDETRAFVDAQNALSTPYLEGLAGTEVFERHMQGLMSHRYPGVPRWRNGRWMIQEFEPPMATVFVQDSLDAERQIVFETRELFEAGETPGRWLDLSPGGTTVGYSVIVDGSDLHEIRFRDIASGDDLPGTLQGVKFFWPTWTVDGRGVFYFRYLRPGNFESDGVDREPVLAYHRLGTTQAEDTILLRSEMDGEHFRAAIDAQGRYLVATRGIWSEGAVYGDQSFLFDLQDPSAPNFENASRVLDSKASSELSFVGSHDGNLYLKVQDETAPAGRIVIASADAPDEWRTLIPPSESVINSAVMAGGHLIVHGKRDVHSELRVFDLAGQFLYRIDLPGPGSVFSIIGHPDRSELHFGFDSFAYSGAIFRHDLTARSTAMIARSEVEFDPDAYVTRQVFVPSSGGTQVPLFISHRKDLELPAPTILHGYGVAYYHVEPMFRPDWGAWMQEGGVIATVNVRGDQAYGAEWAAAGTRERRQNTYDDFIAAAEYLVAESITSPEQLIAQGDSAGGMLVGSVLAQRPDLFAAVVPTVAVLDVIGFARFTAGVRLKTVIGDPMVPAELPWLLSWSPYHNLHDGTCYPAVLIETAINDDLVHPSQSYKFAARLQSAQGCDKPVLLSVADTGGHYGATDMAERLRRWAYQLAFMAEMTGLTFPL
jgi:prolyl oligopeptidase